MDVVKTPSLLPASQTSRLLSLDMIRGLAILGILLLNIYAFGLPPEASMSLNWNQGQFSSADMWRYHLDLWLFRGRFLTLFALLFGVSLWLLSQSSAASLQRRLHWLMLIGACHMAFWWFGDILLWYGLTGWLIFRRGYLERSASELWRKGHQFLAISMLMPLLLVVGSIAAPEMMQHNGFSLEQIAEQQQLWTGPYVPQLSMLLEMMLMQFIAFVMTMYWSFAATMLYGVALFKSGWFKQGFSASKTLLLFVVGSLLSFVSMAGHHVTDYQFSILAMNPLDMMASLLIAFSYGSVLIHLSKKSNHWLQPWLASCGRLAFSLYLLQSCCMVLLFRFIRPDWFAALDSIQLTGIALLGIGVQLLLCRLYLKFYQQGPLEWVWRRLSRAPVVPNDTPATTTD